jgi:hypothetical protein
VAFAALLLLSAAARGEDLQSAVGRLCQGVQGDDAKAAKLVAATTQGEVGEELAVGLLKVAADLAIKSADSKTGLQAGIDAIDALIRKSPGQATYYRSRLELLCQEACRRAKPQAQADVASDVMKRMEAAGDSASSARMWEDADGRYAIALRMAGLSGHTQVALDGKLRMARHFSAATRQAKAAQAAAGTGDKSANARLGMLYLTSLNEPAKAWELLKTESGEVLRTCIPLAMQEAGELHGEALIQLCDWYGKSLATKAEDFARELMLRKARQYAGLAQAKAGSSAPQVQTASDRVKALDEQLAGFSYVGRMLAKNRFLDLLAMADIERDAGRDKWKYAENSFQSSGQDNGSLKLPVKVEGSYQLTLQLAKTKSARDVYVSFPIGDKQLKLHLTEYNIGDWLRGGPGAAWTQDAQGPVLAQVGGRGGGGPGGPPGRGGPGGHAPGGFPGLNRGTGIFMRAELIGTGRQEGSSSAIAIDPQYDKRTWVPYDIDISVKITDAKAAVAVSVAANQKLAWSGDISSIRNEDPESAPITVRFVAAGLAVRSVRLVPRGTVQYSYDDKPPAVAELPAAGPALTSQATPAAASAASRPDGK